MKRLFALFLSMAFAVGLSAQLPVYVWQGWTDHTSEASLERDFALLRQRGVEGVCFNAGFNLDRIRLAARAAKAAGLVYHAWVPCMLQGGLPREWYAVNRLGQSAADVQAYVPYYTCLDPHNKQVQEWFVAKFDSVAQIADVDYVQLDYIRYADVILARGLWKKYGLVMREEYPVADYCYCDDCVADFKAQSGIDIRQAKDPSRVKQWAQFRCNVVTHLVGRIADVVHARGKLVSADVFPGPQSHAVWMVRQEWNKWKVDALFPMNYNDFYLKPAKWVGKVTREEVRAVDGKVPIYSGLFISKHWRVKEYIKDPEGHGLSPDELRTAVKAARKAGARGLCLFSAASMTEDHWKALDEANR
ncbi:MAG: hypothetical protein J6I32_07225 [Bacteroidaceae bacterium]|nr:hypothetical protein [Bacteroidaceae bacterium]